MTTLTPDETLLGLIAIQPRHGYELVDCFRDPAQLGDVWSMSTSQVYAVLKRLERQGWITGCTLDSDTAPTRTEYRLTPEGQAQLERWLNEPNPASSIRRVRVEFLSRLYIARQLNIPAIPMVQRQKAACQAEYEALIQQREAAPAGMAYLALELGIAQLGAVLQWITRCELVPKEDEA